MFHSFPEYFSIEEKIDMSDNWKEKLFCTTECPRCHKGLTAKDLRILSCYGHDAICMKCKKKEEKRPDYEETSKNMIGQCFNRYGTKSERSAGLLL